MDDIARLRQEIQSDIFDYQILTHCLRDYKKPRDKISQLLKNGILIQIKRGVYVFAPPLRKGLLSLEIVAGMLVQPSYISREYALQQYGLMTERVERVTSMTTRKRRHFDTPVGQFDYYSLSQNRFHVGVRLREVQNEGGYLMATKEKALADWVASLPRIANKEDLQFFLYEESRIEKSSLFPLDQALLEEIAQKYQNNNVSLLLKL